MYHSNFLPLASCLLPLALVVRYGADYLNAGYKVEDEGKSAPNAPYALFPIPDSRFPIPDSRFPIPYSLE
ncbi:MULTISPECIES: hypothetical protein [unclassified Moorena]|uniref:hypothetical protein n=1 Tax=unclassified Moorena TaxID=2683338 RepID=UPI0013B73767|nr:MULTISPECIES: hypothetical protein [unclassified Moorena]NEQ13764.1 hypothetical protein [Moorena sp. SIO3E2]NES85958.1 hypothetical protein [Moorena sp. SIO2B7]NEP33674.1 hypothetical protein [Moorena sp. SIO3B2]NEP69708.1 hypothetical protein [Moorena sp. SIO3A5]NEQ08334.1 hypothetical protein [Moorena sp. SIO4E2]